MISRGDTRRAGSSVARGALRVGTLALICLATACGDGTGPVDRTLVVRLDAAPGDDGALIFKVLAAGQERIDTVVPACNGCRVFARRASDVEMRVVVTGNLVPGALVRIGVSNPVPQSYTVFAVEGASRSFQFRPGTEYELAVAR